MKVLFVSEFFHPDIKGGGEISSYLLAKYLSEKNINVHVLTSHNKKEINNDKEKSRIKIHRLIETGNPNTIYGNIKRINFKKSLLKNLEKLEKKENFDLIHCFNITSIYSILLKDKIKKPFILHVNSPVLFCPKGTLIYQDKKECNLECNMKNYTRCYLKSKNFGKIKLTPVLKYNPLIFFYIREKYSDYKKILNKFDYYLAISNYMKNKLIENKIPENKISVIYNIIKKDYFENLKNKNRKENKKNKQKILYLGPYTEPKGCKNLFDTLKEIKYDYIASFYGEGILKEYLLENKNNKIIINNKVNYNEIPEIIKKHDILVIPSVVGEAFSRSALEGLYLNKVVIASNIGGIPDIIEDKKTGFLFNNKIELKNLLEKAISLDLKINKKKIKEKIRKLENYKEIIKIYNSLKNISLKKKI